MRVLLALAFLGAAACTRLEERPDASPVVQAERAFAADAGQRGWVEAFETWSAEDALVVHRAPTSARQSLAQMDPANRGDTSLHWGPEFAAISRDGGFGFTTGPYNGGSGNYGHYFTVWRKQPDGNWRWIFDGGTTTQAATNVDAEAQVAVLAIGARGAGTAEAAIDSVRGREDALAAAAAEDVGRALGAVFASSGWLNREDQPTAIGKEAAVTLAGSGGVRFGPPQVIEASSVGDMVFTLGEARWTGGAGYYCRIWVLQAEGWRVGYDQIMARPLDQEAAPERQEN